MRHPAVIKANPEKLAQWIDEAQNIKEFRQRLAIWMTFKGLHAKRVAELLCVSIQSVQGWIRAFKESGARRERKRKGHGGRRQGFLSLEEERTLVRAIRKRGKRGTLSSIKSLHGMVAERVQKKTGHGVSLGYVYRLLQRHGLHHREIRGLKKRNG